MTEREAQYTAAELKYQRYDDAIGYLVGVRHCLARAESILHTDIRITFGEKEFLDMQNSIDDMIAELAVARREAVTILNADV